MSLPISSPRIRKSGYFRRRACMSVDGSDALPRALHRLCALGAKEKTPHLRGFHWGRQGTIECFMDVPLSSVLPRFD